MLLHPGARAGEFGVRRDIGQPVVGRRGPECGRQQQAFVHGMNRLGRWRHRAPQAGVERGVALAEGNNFVCHAQRIPHQRRIVAVDQRVVVVLAGEPAAQRGGLGCDAAEVVHPREIFKQRPAHRMQQAVEPPLRAGALEGAQHRGDEQRVADAGDVDDENLGGRIEHSAWLFLVVLGILPLATLVLPLYVAVLIAWRTS